MCKYRTKRNYNIIISTLSHPLTARVPVHQPLEPCIFAQPSEIHLSRILIPITHRRSKPLSLYNYYYLWMDGVAVYSSAPQFNSLQTTISPPFNARHLKISTISCSFDLILILHTITMTTTAESVSLLFSSFVFNFTSLASPHPKQVMRTII